MIIKVKNFTRPHVRCPDNPPRKPIGWGAVCFDYDSNELLGKHDCLILQFENERFENELFEFINAQIMFHYDTELENCFILTYDRMFWLGVVWDDNHWKEFCDLNC